MRDGWVSPWWQAMCLPDKWDVCGVVVPSLSVWHVFALANIGNAFTDGGAPTMDAALSLLVIASHDRRGTVRLFSSEAKMERATRRIFRRLRRQDEAKVFAACSEYAETCMRHGTRMGHPGAQGSPAGTPEPWAIVANLMASGFSWDAAWNFPYGQGRAFMDATDERDGRTTMTPWLYGEEMVDNWQDYQNMSGTQKIRIA